MQEYKRLGQVGSCFAQLKDVIELRPIRHRTAERMRGHVQVAALALQRMLERCLLVEFEAVEGGRKRVVTQGSEQARKVLKALNIRRKPPPPGQSVAGRKSTPVVTMRKPTSL